VQLGVVELGEGFQIKNFHNQSTNILYYSICFIYSFPSNCIYFTPTLMFLLGFPAHRFTDYIRFTSSVFTLRGVRRF
jgi:hypothetical protein